MRDDQLATLTVLTVEYFPIEALVAVDYTRYEGPQMVRLEHREFNGKKTAGLVAGLTSTAFVLFLAAAVAAAVGSVVGGWN